MGPVFGYLLGSFCARMYVDVGFVDTGFFSSLKKLLSSPVYILILCEQVLIFSSLIGYFTFKAKYMEQHFGVSSSKANLLIDNLSWSLNTSSITKKAQQRLYFLKRIFHNCSCVLALSPVEGNTSVSLGQCPHTPDCGRSLTSFMVIFGVSSFVKALGITPLIMLMIRIVFLSLMTGLYGFTMLFDLAILVLLRNQSNHEPTVAAQDLRQTNQDEVELRNLNEHSMECSTFNTPEPQAALVKTEKMCNDD
ncbi:solute carrier organic anion transporter family member 1C1-like [Silurus meridionalis]|nr:solute carrier organic anion transporter family member 1C1-like [Silurus meridionalis]